MVICYNMSTKGVKKMSDNINLWIDCLPPFVTKQCLILETNVDSQLLFENDTLIVLVFLETS